MKRLLVFLFPLIPVLGLAQDSLRLKFDTLIQAYNNGHMPSADLPPLINIARELNNNEIVNLLTVKYIRGYLLVQDSLKLYSTDNLKMISDFVRQSGTPEFLFFYNHSHSISAAMGMEDFAIDAVAHVIYQEEIIPVLIPAIKLKMVPHWRSIETGIRKKYNRYLAQRTIIDAQISWYRTRKDSPQLGHSILKRVKCFGPYGFAPEQDWRYNNTAWDMFKCSFNKKELQAAMAWSKKAMALSNNINPEYLDTQANLLYKLGELKSALALEVKALQMAPEAKDIAENLKKMLGGQPTWLN